MFAPTEEDNVNAVYEDGAQETESSNQLTLTLSFRNQLFVFDNVTMDKVQAVFLLLGASELSSAMQSGELPGYQSKRAIMDDPKKCSQAQKLAKLSRFRQRRQKRCFDKKILYNVRREAALGRQRKQGKFISSKNSEDSMDAPKTRCTHCASSSKSTSQMRKGPDGPNTLCNPCGLFWATKGSMRDISKKKHKNPLLYDSIRHAGLE